MNTLNLVNSNITSNTFLTKSISSRLLFIKSTIPCLFQPGSLKPNASPAGSENSMKQFDRYLSNELKKLDMELGNVKNGGNEMQ